MTSRRGAAAAAWRTTVIVSTSLQNHDVVQTLAAQQHRIRISHSVEPGAFIFPQSGLAFLLLEPHDLVDRQGLVDPQDLVDPQGLLEESGLIERTRRFMQLHRNSFVLLLAPFAGRTALDALTRIQNSFFGSNLKILPVRSYADIVKGMLTMAKATGKPHVDDICERMCVAQTHIIDSSPVWKMLRDKL